jgi:hypothetical protein
LSSRRIRTLDNAQELNNAGSGTALLEPFRRIKVLGLYTSKRIKTGSKINKAKQQITKNEQLSYTSKTVLLE